MNTVPLRILGTGLFFLFTFFFGFWLSRTGRPYSTVLFTIHKLLALGAVVFLAISLYKVHQQTPLNPTQMLVSFLAAVCFVTTIITGGLLSIDKALPSAILKLHHMLPYLTLISTGIVLYLVFVRSNELLST